MNTEPEQKILDLYRTYQRGRIDFGGENQTVLSDGVLSSDAQAVSHSEQRVISLYKHFQCDRISKREKVIESVMDFARLQRSQQQNTPLKSHNATTQTIESPAFFDRLFSWLRSGTTGSWQTAAVFSLALVISVVFSTFYITQDTQSPVNLVSIPDLLFTHSQTIVENIEPNLQNQFGFGSNTEHNQNAFQAGVLSVQLPLLIAAENKAKLKNSLIMNTSFIDQTKNPELMKSLNRLIRDVDVTNDREKQTTSVKVFNASIREHFGKLGNHALLDLGAWVEIALLSTQLPETSRVPELKRLLQQGRHIAKRSMAYLPDEPAVLAQIDATVSQDGEMLSTAKGITEFKKKLQNVKAVLL